MDYSFDWNRILFNEFPVHFLLEVILRTAVMFTFLLITLKLTGKRGVKQLSIFETVIIIALGSAAGDPMFYHDVGIVPAIGVFVIVISLYRLVTVLASRNPGFERLIEGKTECLIAEGRFSIHKFDRESLAHDEFFSELRLKGVEHLGQVKSAYLETTGDVSVYFYEEKDIKYGLPLRPEFFCQKIKTVETENIYSCSRCADTKMLRPGPHTCQLCGNDHWVLSQNTRRVK